MVAPWSTSNPVQPAYSKPPIDQEFYNRISSLTAESLACIESFTIAPRSGRAWHVPAGCIVRFSTPDGPQVGDLNIWNHQNPRERLWSTRSRQLHQSHVSVHDQLWSCLPYMRPLVTIVRDSLAGWGKDEDGNMIEDEFGVRWGVHDLMGTRCDPYVNKLISGGDYDYQCHSNLTRAVRPFGLEERDVHDVINIFQATGLDRKGRYCMAASPATSDSYLDLFAEQDLLCALSTCPGGDLSVWGWGEGSSEKSMKDVCRPIRVEVFKIDDKVKNDVLRGWKPVEKSSYAGLHGMQIPTGEK